MEKGRRPQPGNGTGQRGVEVRVQNAESSAPRLDSGEVQQKGQKTKIYITPSLVEVRCKRPNSVWGPAYQNIRAIATQRGGRRVEGRRNAERSARIPSVALYICKMD